ncbi:glycosyltransferase family 9 protein [Lacisediminimonas sp.]|uniref:glycosyltransferase family 9 protein n=1 Tax=Lacisediminimonas sp. TaxID=3060582 RepID=UPI002724E9BC|nr:glycosyltransferase family 9 protein [Lacisediminimonas sp.]MDO8298121.1 glycosyltransferase family 9 protein [Lacisediminimonas sp.]
MKTTRRTLFGPPRAFGFEGESTAAIPANASQFPAPLVPRELIENASQILFITHLALGDFAYLQNFFRAFTRAYPHIAVDLWVDEVRRTADPSQWEKLRNYALYSWVSACPCFRKVYTQTYSPALYCASIGEAQQQRYPLVVSIATLRPHRYAALARAISPRGFVAGMTAKPGLGSLVHLTAWRKLDAAIPPYTVDRNQAQHISAIYADWFFRLFGLVVPPGERYPFVDIPGIWQEDASRQLASWGCQGRRRVFINPIAKTDKRSWPLERVMQLIAAIRGKREWEDACFIVNAMPDQVQDVRKMIVDHGLGRTYAFSAQGNFFQLPAMLRTCDLIISVETSIMHLANAIHVPVIALMRQKNPEWVPIDKENSKVITAAHRRDWVKAITVEQVMASLAH